MASWPVSLPQKPLLEGFSYQLPDTLLETEMEAGEPKVRRRYTAGREPMQVSWEMNIDQLWTFKEWFNNEIAGGAVPFAINHPVFGDPRLARFPKSGLPRIEPFGTGFKVTATLWILR